ncbi:MAG TPA: GGDEF domain-containing protein [Polyangiaceae bacterium]|nr:GGDEF domain-containing protein [Polyangiaceae bacterium]
MFWKKLSGEHKVERPAPERSSGPTASAADDSDQALDTVASLLRSFGNDAFDTDDVPAADTRSECEGWAQRLTVGEGRKEGEDSGPFKRDWGGLRRYFSAHRGKERDYVGRSFTNLREAVQTFARCLTTAVSEEKLADEQVSRQLTRLGEAFQSNDPNVIRKEAESVASLVSEVMGRRKQREAEQLAILGEKIQKLRDELQVAREQAALDPLTQLHNRASLDSHLDRVSDLAFLLNSSPCMLMIDVDHFKKINDQHGHQTGDDVLRRIADALVRQFLRREDFVARYGGEEFVVVIPDSTLQNAKKRADRVREAVGELQIATPSGGPLNVTISVGISSLAEGDTGKSWLARADAALYEAKASGRNTVHVAAFPSHSFASLRPAQS